MANKTVKKVALFTLGTFAGVALSLGAQSFADSGKGNNNLPISSLRTMAEVYGQIRANYVEPKTDDQILEGALKGMVSNLDPHSEYLTVKDYADLRESTSGEFGGLGMEIGAQDGLIKVVSPIEDTPAERAGIKSGDYIVKINDKSTRGMTVFDAVKLMRGEPDTKITLTLSRKDAPQPIVVHLTRAIIKVRSVRSELIEPNIAYIRVTQFQERTVTALADAIKEMRAKNGAPLKGVILDLRDDPGGLLNGAVGVSAAFLKPGAAVVSTRGRDNQVGMSLRAQESDYLLGGGDTDPLAGLPDELKTIPMTVLINAGSASASEIVAGALQDHKRAVIVGTQSFGKGSVQTVIPLSNGAAMKLTTQLYYTPNDRSIQAQGIVPDVEVTDKNRHFESREADLAGHISNPNGGVEMKSRDLSNIAASAPSSQDKADEDEDLANRHKPNPAKDDQLRKALELVKNPNEWQKSLGLAASRPAPKNNQEDDK